jgi:polyisoprenoid-binding protein YceI
LLIVGSQHADAGHAIRSVKTDVPGTTCSLDKAHASLIFRVSHLAFSNWTGRFLLVMTAPNKADVTGDLTLHGVTKQVTLHTTFNGGWAKMPLDSGGARIGYSAKGSLDRSDFGITMGLSPKGTTMGVGDLVSFQIEAEFSEHPPVETKQ